MKRKSALERMETAGASAAQPDAAARNSAAARRSGLS